jgi:predicted dehydrogenase
LPLRVGLVGCGYQGRCLATAASRTSTVDLVACADPDPAALRSVAALGPAMSTHSSVDALLDEAAVDAVLVATPSCALYPVSLAAIRAGKHVLVEKPVALNAKQAAHAESEAARAGVTYMAGYSCRFSLARHVHDLIAAGLVGEVQAITAQFGCERLDRGWLASPETGGGPLLFLGSHLVDMVLWFADDDPVEVSAHLRRREGTGIEDTSAFLVQFARGALAQCLVTQAASTFFYTVDVHGRAGRVTLRGWSFLEYEVEVRSTAGHAYATPTVIRPPVDGDHITMMLVPELDELASAIADGRPPSITADDGRRVLQVLDAVVKASHTSIPVKLG